MKTFMLQLLACSLFLAPLSALAQGDHTGGGGDLAACVEYKDKTNFWQRLWGKDKKTRYYLYDVYEQGHSSNRWPNLDGPGKSIREKIQLIIDDYAKLDPVRAKRYGDEAIRIWDDLEPQEKGGRGTGYAVLQTFDLPPIDDTNEQYKYPCKYYQMVRQEEPVKIAKTLGAAVYSFVEKWWNKLNKDNKVATIFHEVIYREMRNYGAPDSLPTRNLNSYIYSRTAHLLPIADYLGFLSANGAREYYMQTNIGLVRLFNTIKGENIWSAWITDDGLITNVSVREAEVDLKKLDLGGIATLGATELKFDRSRQLVGLTGKFAVAYDESLMKIREYRANCEGAAFPCIEADSIQIDPLSKRIRISGNAVALTFDNAGNILSH